MDEFERKLGEQLGTPTSNMLHRTEQTKTTNFDRAPRETSRPMLEVEIVTSIGTVVCRPKGTLDATTVTTFKGAVALCLGEPALIVDLSGVSFIDGAGLTALVGAVRRAREQRSRVVLVVPAGGVRKVLDGSGLDLVVSVLETVDLAMPEFQDNGRTAERVHTSGKSKMIPCARSVGR